MKDEEAKGALESLKILIVEDDPIAAADWRATLEREGYSVCGVAGSGEAALTIAEAEQPGLALVDIRLTGGIDGIEAAGEMNRRWSIPVVFLTGYSKEKVLKRAREARPVGYLRKPFNDGELLASLQAASDRIRLQGQFQSRSRKLQEAVAGLDEAAIASDVDGRVAFLNRAAEEITGWKESEALGQMLREVASVEEIGDELESEPAVPVARSGERLLDLKKREGEKVRIRERSTPVRGKNGELLGLVMVFRPAGESDSEVEAQPGDEEPVMRAPALEKAKELSQRRSFRELLGFADESDEKDRPEASDLEEVQAAPAATPDLIEEIADPLLTMDESGLITYANAEALAYFGGKSALIGQNFWKGFTPRVRARYSEAFGKPLLDGQRHTFEFNDSERRRWLEVSAYRSGDGILALFRDISERKRGEAESVRVQRLEGLGLLARGFAHDFNNLLTVLIGNLDLATERFPDDEEFQQEMKNAEDAAENARKLVQQLLTFSRGGRPIREPTRVATLLRTVLEEKRRDHPDIRYQFQCANPDLRVNLDRGQITRLIENLVDNSEQAMAEKGGTLIARCAITDGEEVARWRGSPVSGSEEHLVIEIIDTGCGMSEEDLEHAFEPYFTTRSDANATGIGLTVCESIAKAHDGFILLQSKVGRGTIATLCMPRGAPAWADEEVEATGVPLSGSGPGRSPESEAGHARILVLEDDLQIRRLITVTLQRDGHEVVETDDGRETLRAYREAREKGRPFDLILSDLTIENGVGGVETMRALRRLDPNVVAIVSSGYSDAPAMARPTAFGFSAVLPKPYPPKELRRLVNSVLAKQVRNRDQS